MPKTKFQIGDRVEIDDLDCDECEHNTDIPSWCWAKCLGCRGEITDIGECDTGDFMYEVMLDIPLEFGAYTIELVHCTEDELDYE